MNILLALMAIMDVEVGGVGVNPNQRFSFYSLTTSVHLFFLSFRRTTTIMCDTQNVIETQGGVLRHLICVFYML